MSSIALVSRRRAWVFALSLTLLLVPRAKDDANRLLVAAQPAGHARLSSAALLLSFEPNLGQADPRVQFLARGRGYTLFLTKDEAVVALPRTEVRSQKSEGQEPEEG